MKRLARIIVCCAALLAATSGARPAHAVDEVITDLSSYLVAITTGFTGKDVLLFGAIEGEGDIVVVVKGPTTSKVVRRKERVVGIWINRAEMMFSGVPGYYAVGASAPIDGIASESVRERHEIGAKNLKVIPPQNAAPAEVETFRKALFRRLEAEGLYRAEPAPIRFLGRRLFRTDIRVPANAPTGVYPISVYLLRDGKVADGRNLALTVNKVGFEAGVFDLAHRHALAYGVLAILIAVVAGWSASAVFHKG